MEREEIRLPPESRGRILKHGRLLVSRFWRRKLISLWYRHTDGAPAPINSVVRVTNGCNLRCRQCGQWGDEGVFRVMESQAMPRQLSTSEWKTVLERLVSFCPHVYFFGGEPFVRKDVLELVRTVSRRATVGINTNGTLMKGKGHEIVSSGLDYMIVSLDGPQEVNNKIRIGSANGYARVIEGVEELIRAKQDMHSRYPRIELLMTLTAENQHHISATAEIAKKLQVDKFAVGFGIFTTPALARESARLAREELGTDPKFFRSFVRDMGGMRAPVIEEQICEAGKLWGAAFKTYPPMKFDVREYFERPEQPLVNGPCLTPWTSIQILPNGDVAFCSDFPDFVVGNVAAADLLRLWNAQGSRAWRNRIRTKGILPAETRCCDYYL
jgi:MoaA/NifB/PqqE/SkfB family radical SAM enzyme